jgi:hypothetical protein
MIQFPHPTGRLGEDHRLGGGLGVVGQDPLDPYPMLGEEPSRLDQEPGAGLGGLVSQDLAEGDSGAVIDGRVEVVVADAAPPAGSRPAVGEVLTECAWAAARSRDTYLSAQYWRLARRIGKKKAAVAVGHSILVIAWHLLTDDCDYQDLGGDYFIRRDTDRQRQRAVAQLQALGDRVVLEPVAA